MQSEHPLQEFLLSRLVADIVTALQEKNWNRTGGDGDENRTRILLMANQHVLPLHHPAPAAE
jgi:hypothetical protein